ncbi:MAG: ATP-binding protein [Phycisphaerales bacterium]|jgi:signal transduction histidine kinase|nr:ATP-binding protein [Phycisphaerales bacterium]
MHTLTVIQGSDSGRVFPLPEGEPQLIGRSTEALPFTDQTISRRHAELTPDAGRWFLRDLESQNGTYVNGAPIRHRVELQPGDQVRVGATVFVFGAPGHVRDLPPVRLLRPGEIESEIERTIPSNDDSMILAEPEPRAAALEHLRIIYQLTQLTTSKFNERDALLRSVMELVFAEFRPERGVIVLRNSAGELEPVVAQHKTPPRETDDASIGVSRTIIQHAMRQGEGVLSTNAMSDPRFASGDSVQRMSIRSAICSPIKFRERTFGAIYIDSSIANYTFTAEQLALMNAVAMHTGLALANNELYADKLHAERLAAVGETIAVLSHSIKNILQGLRGGADVVDMGLKREDLKIARGGWDILRRNLDRIVSLTMNMLAFSRPAAIELELSPLGLIVEDCAQLLESLCARRNLALVLDLDPEMPPIPIDAGMIHQALMNLLTNAVEAVPEGGIVTVRTLYRTTDPLLGQGPTYAEIRVIDNGPGIPPDRARWIFEPFRTTKGQRGTGLGLAVTKRLVEEHRGRIAVESNEGVGTTFTITLPADAGEHIDPSATAKASAQKDARG